MKKSTDREDAAVGSAARATAPGSARRARSFRDDEGNLWRVSEQSVSEYDRRRGSSLIFENEIAVRRVRSYPEDWAELSDAELTKLSWGL
jgi:hypothetical protein